MLKRLAVLMVGGGIVLGGAVACGGRGAPDPETGTEFSVEELRRIRDSGEGLSGREQTLLEEAERAEAQRNMQQ